MWDASQLNDLPDGGASANEPMWLPDGNTIRLSNIYSVLQGQSFESYRQFYEWSVNYPAKFWALVLDILQIQFDRPPRRILDISNGPTAPTWLPGALLNIVESCFHADAAAPAIIHGGRSTELQTLSFGELRCQANQVANGLKRLGLSCGDAVALFMPMTARSVPIYLGLILAGCVVVSIADSFASDQVLLRLRVGGAKAVFTAAFVQRGGKRIALYDRVRGAENIPAVLVDDELSADVALRPGDMLWQDFLGDMTFNEVVHVEPSASINVLFSSGTTGEPKAIPWDHVTPIKSASDGYFHHDIHQGDVVGWPTNYGWMMGPWLTFATLINRGTIALYDDQPLDEAFGHFVQDARINILGIVPSMVCQWRRTGCMEGLDWSNIRVLSSTGECSNPEDMRYLSRLAGGKPVIEYCGGTEIGGGYIASTVVQPNIPSTFSTPTLGSAFVILGEDDKPSNMGELYLIPPSMGMSRHLLNGDHDAVYYEGAPAGPNGESLRRHGDRMQELPGGYFRALGRTDDTLNISGIKVGVAEIERVLCNVPGVLEVAVIGVSGPQGGPTCIIACVGMGPPPHLDREELHLRLQAMLSSKFNPLFKLFDVYELERLPRTASNKIVRRELRKAYEVEHKHSPP